jgi:hypothetical protein
MQRLWIVVVTVIAGALLAGQTGIAGAAVGHTRPATSCSDLIRTYHPFGNARNAAGQGSPASTQKYYANLAKTYRQLSRSGPSQLRSAFKHLAQYMARLSQIDFSNPSSVQQLGPQLAASAQALQPDIQKIAAYFASVCHYTSPTT